MSIWLGVPLVIVGIIGGGLLFAYLLVRIMGDDK